jgi:golgin subfamily B member 1
MLPGDPDDETSFTGSLSDGGHDESVEDTLAREQRWDDLVARLVERAESTTEPSRRVQSLMRAALVYEAKLDDLEKAFLILQAAFAEDFTNEEVSSELARVTTAAGKWGVLVSDCEDLMTRLPTDRKRVDLLLAMAQFYEVHLRDLVAAEQILAGAVSIDPRDITALRGLATLSARRGDWVHAVEHLASAAEASRNSLEKVRLHLEAASIFESQLADFTRAARQYQKVLALSRGNPMATEALARLAPELDDKSVELVFTPEPQPIEPLPTLEAVGAHEYPAAPSEPTPPPEPARTPAPAPDRAEAALSAARAALHRNDPTSAVAVLGRVLQERPEHRGCRLAMVEACTAAGDHTAALHHRKALLGILDDAGERFALLLEHGRQLRDLQGDQPAALAAFQEALGLRPDDHGVLHDVLDLLSKGKQWKNAVAVLGKLASLETGKARARYLVATGNILNYELHALDEAVDFYNQALDEDADDLKTFERIEKILGAKRAWRDEARNFRRMIKRLGPNPPAAKRPVALLLWKGLGEICRTRLKDYEAAAAAYEVCASLDPGDASYLEILAEIFERQGPQAVPQALEKRCAALQRAVGRDETVRHLRALLRLHTEGSRPDRTWCTCAALVACGAAEPEEQEWYHRLAARPMVLPRGALSEEMWQRGIYHPREDRRLSRLFATVSPTVTMLRAKDARASGLDERRRVPEQDGSMLSQMVSYACGLLGVGRPSLYVDPRRAGTELVNVIEHGMLAPALVVGAELAQPRPERELAFLVGRAVAMLRFEHMVLWPQVIASAAELRVVLLAVLRMFQPALEVPGIDGGAVSKYTALLQRHLPPHVLEPLMSVVPQLTAEAATLDILAWSAGAQHTATRAGLVVCGDLLSATKVLAEDPGRGLGGDEVVADLIRWSVSTEHLALREQLGLLADPGAVPSTFEGPRHTAAVRRVDDRGADR